MQEGVTAFDVKLCESCFATYRAALPVCPYCSSERVVKGRMIEQIEGELAEIQRAAMQRAATKSARDLESIARIAVERGYKVGWIAQRMKHIGARPASFSEIHAAMSVARRSVAA